MTSVSEPWGAQFETVHKMEVCTNAADVIRQIREVYAGVKNSDLARKAGISYFSITRWINTGRANGSDFRRLLTGYPVKKSADLLLGEATPRQLYQRCKEVGWDCVIGSI